MVADSHSRPTDFLLPTWRCGHPATLDIHIISPLQDLILCASASTPGHALRVGVQRKLMAHLSDCRAAGMDFVPIVVETLGGLSEDTISTVRKAISKHASPDDPSTSTGQLFHRLAISSWRGNARLGSIDTPLSLRQSTASFDFSLNTCSLLF